MGTTTAMCSSFKQDLPSGWHNFLAPYSSTGTTTSGNFTITSLAATPIGAMALGSPVTMTNVPTGAVVASIDSTTQITVSKAATASASGSSITVNGDTFKFALVKVSPTGTYGAASTNYSNITGNSDEVSGTGYTAGGFAWTPAQNISPGLTGTQAFWSWSVNPSWTSASFSCTGGMLYNSSARNGTANKAVCVEDFGGTQTVASGTFTVVLPTNAAGTSILQIN